MTRAGDLARVVGAGMFDAELAALAWLLLEDGVPLIVAGPGPGTEAGRDAPAGPDERDVLLDALVAALPPGRRPDQAAAAGVGRLVRVAGCLSISTPAGLLRAALRATTGRSGLAATIEATDLAEVLAVLRRQGLADDEISFLGVVLLLGGDDGPGPGAGDTPGPGAGEAPDRGASRNPTARVIAAHYLRPVARDAGGHVQRLGPAVLATWDPRRARYDHFAWGIYPELAARTGRRTGDLEHAHRERVERLGEWTPSDPA